MIRVPRSKGVLVPLGIGLGAGALTIAYAALDPRRALVAWIAAYGLCVASVVAAMVVVMVLHLTGARWWLVLRRVVLAAAGTAPVLVLLFVPIGAAFSLVYPWSSTPPGLPEPVDAALEHQRAWNHPAFFLARSAVYLATWTTFAILLRRADAAHVASASPEIAQRERRLGAIGLPLTAFTLTFAAFDWLMSLQPGWTSNVFGVYVFTSGLVTAIAAIAIATWLVARSDGREAENGAPRGGVAPDHVHALGRLLLMAVVLWTYIGFFQLLLVWIANLPHEVAFYDVRARGSWTVVDVLLFAGRFALPFLALLSRPLKRRANLLAGVAAWLLVTSVLDFAWLVIPAAGGELAAADLLPFVCVPSLVWAYGAHLVQVRRRQAESRPDIAIDPALRDALRYRSP